MDRDRIIEQLDKAYPEWRLDYGLDPLSAAYELGLLSDDDLAVYELEQEESIGELDFDD